MAKGVSFDKKSATRIGNVVRKVEGAPQKLYKERFHKGGASSRETWTLQHSISGNTVTITGGYWIRQGLAPIEISQDSTVLSGAPGEREHVWIKLTRDTTGIVLGHSVNYPNTQDSTHAYCVLVSFLNTGGNWGTVIIHHKGDISYDLPLV